MPKETITPECLEFGEQQQSPTDPDTRRENERSRIEEVGLGAELFRRVRVAKLREHFEAFCEHGSIVDISALEITFDLIQHACDLPATHPRQQATLVECFLRTLGLSPEKLINNGVQRRSHQLP